jgi:hypothetical protein
VTRHALMEMNVPRLVPAVLVVVLLCVIPSVPAWSQTTTVVNPKVVEFDPSVDHSVMTAGGEPMVSRYDLQVFLQGATQPIASANLGKPSPDPDGKIRVDFSTILVGWPLATGTYQARVAAVGSTGAGLSDPSNMFDFQVSAPTPPAPCTYSLSASVQSATATGGTMGVTVTASASTCTWTAASNAAWVTVSPSTGTGTGSMTVTVAANAGAARTATVTVGGQAYTVTQAAVPCGFTLSSGSATVSATGGTSSVGVTANLGTCGWTAATNAAWATVTPASGTGTGSVTVTVAANTGAARTATATVGGQAYTLTQAAAPACTFSVASSAASLPAAASAATVSLTASASTCAWTASTPTSWITVTTSSGTGSGSVAYSVAKNNSLAQRFGTLTVGGKVVTVTQAAGVRPNPPKGVKIK